MKYKNSIDIFKNDIADEIGQIFANVYLMGVLAEREAAIKYLSKNSSKRAAETLKQGKHIPRGKNFLYLKDIEIDQDYFE